MKKITKILACIDLSDYSRMTLEYAVQMAKNNNAEIIVYSVVNERDFRSYSMASIYLVDALPLDEYIKKTQSDRKDRLKEFIKTNFFDDKHLMILKIDQGIPFERILKAIESEGVDLVVMANKGRGNVSGMLFGSAAEKVFRHSPVPVLSVREREKFKRS